MREENRDIHVISISTYYTTSITPNSIYISAPIFPSAHVRMRVRILGVYVWRVCVCVRLHGQCLFGHQTKTTLPALVCACVCVCVSRRAYTH